MADKMTKPPATDENGVALHGKHPLNHRLRAESLAKAGAKEDPDNIVSSELIEDAGKRLKSADKVAAAKAKATETDSEQKG